MMHYMPSLRAPVSVFLLLLTAGCSALSALGGATTPLDVYELRVPQNVPVVTGRALSRDVIVELPTTGGALETDRIMIRPNPLQAQYLPEVRWSEPTPVMIQTLMVRTLSNTQGLRYVGRRPLGAGGDYAIVTELIDFQAESYEGSETASIKLRLTSSLVRERDARIVASRTFTASAESASTETPALAEAFDRAAGLLMIDFAEWTLANLRGR